MARDEDENDLLIQNVEDQLVHLVSELADLEERG